MKKIFCILTILFPFIGNGMNTPVPSSPANAVSINSYDVFLYVSPVTGATGYHFQIDTLATFNSAWRRQDSSSNYFNTPALRSGKTYYWRVRAYKSGDTSAWSTSRYFTITTTAYTLTSPANLSSGNIKALFAYYMGSSPGIGYQYQLDTNATLNSPLKVDTFLNENRKMEDTNVFDFGRTIFWRARAFNSLGDTTSWSPVWKYTIVTFPQINGSTTVFSSDPLWTVSWPTAELAHVELWADSTSGFNSPGLFQKIINPGIIQDSIYDMDFGKYYYYKIRMRYANKVSGWSAVRMIKIYDNGFINGPSNGQTVGGLTVSIGVRQLNGANKRITLYADSLYTQVLADTLLPKFAYFYSYPGQLGLNKKYYIRVQYLHAKDTAAPLFAWFKTYTGQVNLGAPSHLATKIEVRPRFSFRKYTWTNNYVMEIDTGSTFQAIPSSYFIRVDTFKYDGSYYHYIDTVLAYNQKYVWRVYGVLGNDTAEATVRTFTTATAPANYFPQNNYIGIGTSTNALVTGINGSSHIQWELDTTLNFNSGLYLTGTDKHIPDGFTPQYVGLNFPIDLHFSSKYYWRARCINRIDTSLWSVPFNFTTTQNPWLTAPANGSVNLTTSVKLEWGIQGSASELRYQYQLGTDSLFTSAPITTLAASSSAVTTVNVNYATKYYWRARAYHSQDTSPWSVIWNFTTQNAPVVSIPALYFPANGATNLPLTNIELSWSLVSNAITYDIQISNSSDFAVILTSGNTSGNAILFNGAQAKTRYYWRVRGRNNNIVGLWSVVRWFETMPPTGVENAAPTVSVSIVPNPSHQKTNIICKGFFDISVLDSKGKVVFGSNQNQDFMELETATWATGIYTVYVKQNDRIISEKLLVIH